MEKLFSRLPIIFNVVIFSPHGYFGQADVLGLPDTGGQVNILIDSHIRSCSLSYSLLNICWQLQQVVYILDQVRALEEELLLRIGQQGINAKPQILVVSFGTWRATASL